MLLNVAYSEQKNLICLLRYKNVDFFLAGNDRMYEQQRDALFVY